MRSCKTALAKSFGKHKTVAAFVELNPEQIAAVWRDGESGRSFRGRFFHLAHPGDFAGCIIAKLWSRREPRVGGYSCRWNPFVFVHTAGAPAILHDHIRKDVAVRSMPGSVVL